MLRRVVSGVVMGPRDAMVGEVWVFKVGVKDSAEEDRESKRWRIERAYQTTRHNRD